jgi:hypothetical protein
MHFLTRLYSMPCYFVITFHFCWTATQIPIESILTDWSRSWMCAELACEVIWSPSYDFYLCEHMENVYEVRMEKRGVLVKPYSILQGVWTIQEFCDLLNSILKGQGLRIQAEGGHFEHLLTHCHIATLFEVNRTMSFTNVCFIVHLSLLIHISESRNFVTVANRTLVIWYIWHGIRSGT